MKPKRSRRAKATALAISMLAAGGVGSTARIAWAQDCCAACERPDGSSAPDVCVYNCSGTCGVCGNCCAWGVNCD
jgi:hypothetical protein